jgi:hypothetical protein
LIQLDKEEESKERRNSLRKLNNIDIHLFSKEMIRLYNSVGIYPPLIDSITGYTYPEELKYTLNVPKDMTIGGFIFFLSKLLGIEESRIKLFKFILTHFHFDMTKRFKYLMIDVERDMYDHKISEFGRIGPQKQFLLYVHINGLDDEISLFSYDISSSTIPADEFIINRNTEESIYIYPWNTWRLNRLSLISENRISIQQTGKRCLIFIKYLRSIGPDSYDLVIDDVFDVGYNDHILPKLQLYGHDKILNRYSKYLPQESIENAELAFLIEENSKENQFANCKEVTPLTEHTTCSKFLNGAISVIVCLNFLSPREPYGMSLLHNIRHCIEGKIDTIRVRFKLLLDKTKEGHKYLLHGEKVEVNFTQSHEALKETILSALKHENALELFQTQGLEHIIFIEPNKFTLSEFIQRLDTRALYFIRDKKNRYYMTPNNILQLLHTDHLSINFKLNFLLQDRENYDFITFVFYDIDNNPITMMSTYIPKKTLFSTNKLINYIRPRILNDYYANPDNEEFFIILQSIDRYLAFEMFDDKDESVRRYEGTENLYYEYRLQPYPQDELMLISLANKIFVSVMKVVDGQTKYYSPLVIYASSDSTIREFKDRVIAKLCRIKGLMDVSTYKLRFHIMSLTNYTPVRLGSLDGLPDDMLLSTSFKISPKNLQIEILSGNNVQGLILKEDN